MYLAISAISCAWTYHISMYKLKSYTLCTFTFTWPDIIARHSVIRVYCIMQNSRAFVGHIKSIHCSHFIIWRWLKIQLHITQLYLIPLWGTKPLYRMSNDLRVQGFMCTSTSQCLINCLSWERKKHICHTWLPSSPEILFILVYYFHLGGQSLASYNNLCWNTS